MAHFARLESKTDPTGFTSDTHLVVVRVHVVGNDNPANGTTIGENDMHVDGEEFCKKFYKGGIWKQTSYNHNFRKQYCGRGYVYDPVKDIFLQPQPYASWALDGNDDWQAPVTHPTDTTDKMISWDEDNLRWTATDNSNPVNNFNWDASALAWVSA